MIAGSELMTDDTPAAGTGIYVGDFPTAITAAGVYFFRGYVGATPTPGNPVTMPGSVNWTGAAATQAIPPTAQEIAAAVLQTDLSLVDTDAANNSLCTVCLATLHSSMDGTTWTIRKTDGTTKLTKTLTVSAGGEPIVGVM